MQASTVGSWLAVAELMGELPIYETLLERDLMKGGIHPHPTQAPLIVEVEIDRAQRWSRQHDETLPAVAKVEVNGAIVVGAKRRTIRVRWGCGE